MEGGQVGFRTTVGVGAIFTEDLDTVEIADLHEVREVMERIFVYQGDEADHERNTAAPTLDVGVASLHQEDAEEVVPEFLAGFNTKTSIYEFLTSKYINLIKKGKGCEPLILSPTRLPCLP